LSEVAFQSNQTVKQAIMSQPDSVIYGKWQLFQSENFEAFMSRLGVSYLVRKLGNKSTPIVTVSKGDDDVLSFKQESLVSTSEIKFKLGEQFDEKSADGRMLKSTQTLLAPNSIKHEMLGTNGGKDSVCIRTFFAEQMTCVCTVEDVETTRTYKKIP